MDPVPVMQREFFTQAYRPLFLADAREPTLGFGVRILGLSFAERPMFDVTFPSLIQHAVMESTQTPPAKNSAERMLMALLTGGHLLQGVLRRPSICQKSVKIGVPAKARTTHRLRSDAAMS